MRYISGTSNGGQIIGTRANTKVFSIEFHAKLANSAEVTVGDSTVTLSDGMGLEPDDRHSPDFLGADGVRRSVDLRDLYTAVSGSDKVDWAAQVEP
jgi:hypothetical protein